MNDIRFALRQLRKSPGFTALAVFTLAVAIGMNTAIFTLINDLFLRGLPFKDPARLVRISSEAKERNLQQLPFSIPRFWHYRDGQSVFSGIAADAGTGFILTGFGDPIQINGFNVTANYFDLLGVRPILGRGFLPEEEQKADVALVSERFWKRRLGGDSTALGRNLTLNGVPTSVVGVLPNLPIALFGPDVDVITVKPFDQPGTPREVLMRGVSYMRVTARLKPGVTIEQARAGLAAVQQGYRVEHPENADNSWTPVIVSIAEDTTGTLRPAFLTLLGAVGFVLLIACSNVANLLLVRFTGRKREIALRVALGASRSGIVRLFVLESTIMTLIAGIIGLCLASWIVAIVPRLAGQNLAIESSGAFQSPVLLFTIIVSLITGVLMGAYPAWQSSRSDLVSGLKDGGRAMTGSCSQHRLRRGLVTAQVGLSVVLLAGAALLITSFVRLSQQEAGFKPERIWLGGVGLPPARYPDRPAYARFTERLLNNLRNLPGFESVSLSEGAPLDGNFSQSPYARADQNPPPINQRPLGLMHSISPGFLRTYCIPLISGRDIDEHDGIDRPLVVLISKSTAQRLFPNENPVGKRMYFGTNNGTGELVEIVGVVGDIRYRRLDREDEVEFYRPFTQRAFPFMSVSVRSRIEPAAVVSAVRNVLNQIDNELPIIQPNTMTAIIGDSLGQQRLTTTLLASFAAVALLLAIIGIYGAVAYTVEQRTGEIGVRMALGAQTRDVLQLVVRQGMLPVALGVGLGLICTFAIGRFITAQLYQVSPQNPLLLLSVTLFLCAVALIACLVPARHAALIDPIQALRIE